jgi:hypothetical protein
MRWSSAVWREVKSSGYPERENEKCKKENLGGKDISFKCKIHKRKNEGKE